MRVQGAVSVLDLVGRREMVEKLVAQCEARFNLLADGSPSANPRQAWLSYLDKHHWYPTQVAQSVTAPAGTFQVL